MTLLDSVGDYVFEICANSIQSCHVAEQAGAHRVELCAALTEGGTTPSAGMIKQARAVCQKVKLNVIIRPRGGDFFYDEDELKVMEDDIKMARDLGADGIVLGCLMTDGSLDENALERLLRHAGSMSVTFHRAFDVCSDMRQMLERLIAFERFDRILTSGAKANALSGAWNLKELVEQAAGRIVIMAGAGVNMNNIREIANISGVKEFHFSGKGVMESPMRYYNPEVFMGLPHMNEYERQITSLDNVQNTMAALKS